MDVLVKYGIPIIVSSNSAVVEYDHAPKFPAEIIAVLDEQTKQKDNSSKSLNQQNNESSDIGKLERTNMF